MNSIIPFDRFDCKFKKQTNNKIKNFLINLSSQILKIQSHKIIII